MHIGFYSPYLDSLGGGERYVLALASHWSMSHNVDIFWDEVDIRKKAKERFHIDLSKTTIVHNIFRGKNIFKKLLLTRQYDLIFFLTDGSIPSSLARKNILHFQVPFAHLSLTPWKLARFTSIICNSEFTKQNLDVRLQKKAIVIYPPVTPIPASPKIKKESIILSVGRFSGHFQAKKQEILIDAFAKAQKNPLLKKWKLVLAGGLLESDKKYFLKLKKMATDMPIEFFSNISQGELTALYQTATMYWHAAGFGETEPARMEHFGITTVEAMSAGCVVLAYNAGGQTEIVKDSVNGFLWNTIDELVDKTATLLQNPSLLASIKKDAVKTPERFSEERFFQSFDALL